MFGVIFGAAAAIALGLLIASLGLLLTLAVYQMCATALAAPAATAIAALFLALLIVATAAAALALLRNGRERAQPQGSESALMGLIALVTGRELSGLFRTHPYAGGLGALAAGIAVGASPELRSALRRVVLGG